MTCWPLYCHYQRGGTCWRACVATILRVGFGDVPEIIDSRHDPEGRRLGSDQLARTRRVLRARGLDLVRDQPAQEMIEPAPEGVDGDLVIAGVLVDGHDHALVAVEADGVLYAIWDPDLGSPRGEYPLVDVTRVVAWPRPSKVAAALRGAVPPAS